MKNILLVALFALTFSAYAQVVPRATVIALPFNVQVTVYNNTDSAVRCSGFINARTQRGFTDSHYYFEIIYRGQRSFRTFYPRNFNDRYLSAYDTIRCTRY